MYEETDADGKRRYTVNQIAAGPACPHEHGAKHLGGWTVRQTSPGHFVWTSRTGNDYPSAAKPIMPWLPEPDPPPDGQRSSVEPDEYAADAPIWANNPYPGPRVPRQRGRAPDDARAPDHARGPEVTGPRPPPADDDPPF